MLLTIFAKKRNTKDGKPFATYLTTLTKKTGESIVAQVKFGAGCPQINSADCPMNIDVDKKECNYSEKKINAGEETKISRTLWVKNYSVAEIPFEDRSMDDFED